MASVTLHEGQSQVFNDVFIEKTVKHAVVVCSRGWGKSYFAGLSGAQAVGELIALPGYVPNKVVHIIAPTYDQVTDIYYPMLAYEFGLEDRAAKYSRALGRFWFPNNVELQLLSYEAIERMRGKGSYLAILDEVSSWRKGVGLKEAWESIIQPCIVTRWSKQRAEHYGATSPGRSITISTPMGYNYLHDMFHFSERDPEWRSYHFDYTTSPFLDPVAIERVKHTIDPLKFNREYKASFEDSGNRVFYCFDRKVNVRSDIEDVQDHEDIHVCIDFNVGLQCSSAFVIRGGQVFFIDEFSGHPDTEQLAIAINKRYEGHKIYAYPDPSGRSRKTSAPVGQTDFTILQKAKIVTKAHNKAPPISDSVNAVNRLLLNAAGETNLYVHPRCTGLIKSLERTVWTETNPDIATIDKSEGVEHYSDGVRYGMEYLYPIKKTTASSARGFGF